MNKKIQKIFFVGATLVAFAGMTVACKDYDDDIDALTEQVNTLSSQVSSLQSSINAGSVITNVAKTSDGITVTLSNGQSYTITNGKDGANGTSGASGSVITIGDNGNWCIDGKDTGLAAAGKDGETIYYTPGTDGYWYKVTDGGEPEKTDISCCPEGTLSAAWDKATGTLTIYNADGTSDAIVLTCKSTLSSLVFIPQIYANGIEGLKASEFVYITLRDSLLDSAKEEWKLNPEYQMVGLPVTAEYHVNPMNAAIDETFTLSTNVIDAENWLSKAAEDHISIDAAYAGLKDGVLSVDLTINGQAYEAYYDTVTVFSLNAKKDTIDVTSDYATLVQDYLYGCTIAMDTVGTKPNDPTHLRTDLDAVSTDSQVLAKVASYAVWPEEADEPETLEDAAAQCDTAVCYNSSLDLNKIVAVHYYDEYKSYDGAEQIMTDETFKSLGLSWDFSVVKNYKIGTPATDQADFVTLKDGIFTPKVYGTDGKAAIGRTPIIRVKLMRGEKVLSVAYLKVYISETEPEKEVTPEVTFDLGEFKFACGAADTLTTTVEEMNVELYNKLGYSKADFHKLFDTFEDTDAAYADSLGTAKDSANAQTDGTHVIAWIMTNDQLWNAKGETLTHKVAYVNNTTGRKVVIALTAKMPSANKTYNLEPGPDYIAEYWNDDKTITYYNVAVPDQFSIDSTKCLFVNDINASFTTKEGLTYVDDAVTALDFYFCPDVTKITKIGDQNVTFAIENDSTELYIETWGLDKNGKPDTLDTPELVATIANGNAAVPYNTITLNKESDKTKVLLNTNKLYTYIGATGYLCDDTTKPVAITFNGEDHFQANFVRPIEIASKAADSFIDAVDFGQDGSFIALEDLIAPTDWRGRAFDPDYTNYWDYYGTFSITVDTATAECNLNGKRQVVPATVVLEQTDTCPNKEVKKDKNGNDTTEPLYTSNYGWLTYKNNGTHVKSFEIYVKVSVKYGWGIINTDFITIPVQETIGSAN